VTDSVYLWDMCDWIWMTYDVLDYLYLYKTSECLLSLWNRTLILKVTLKLNSLAHQFSHWDWLIHDWITPSCCRLPVMVPSHSTAHHNAVCEIIRLPLILSHMRIAKSTLLMLWCFVELWVNRCTMACHTLRLLRRWDKSSWWAKQDQKHGEYLS